MLGRKHGYDAKLLRFDTSDQFVTKIISPDLNYTKIIYSVYITIHTADIRSRISSADIVTSPKVAEFVV